MGVRIGASPLAGRGGRRFLPTVSAVNYSPLRSSTHNRNTYTAKPLPWWNTIRLNGTTSTGGTMSETHTETETTETEIEVEHPVDPLPGQVEIEQPEENDDDDA